MERWTQIDDFPDYSVSSAGRVRNDHTGRIIVETLNNLGLLRVGLMRDGVQYHRSVPRLVANAFIPIENPSFDTPINLNGDRTDNRVENLVWRPRWFAVRYNRQFRYPYHNPIKHPIVDLKSGDVSANSLEACVKYGLLEQDLVLSIMSRTYVWPTYQEFGVLRA